MKTLIETLSNPTEDGLYSLKALCSSAGDYRKVRPTEFLKLPSIKEKVVKSHLLGNVIVRKTQGRNGDTFVNKKLVYRYAMWISDDFHDLVIDAFDQLTTTTTQQALINLKHQVDNAMQSDLFNPWTSPRDPRSLPAIMHCSPFQANQYNDELVGKGILGYRYVIQTPRRVYHAIKQHPAILGSKGDTILFNEAELKKLFPTQLDLVDFVGGVA